MKQPASRQLDQLVPNPSPTRQSPKQYEGDSSHQESRGSTMGDKNTQIDGTITAFEFLIQETRGKAPMKNIPLSSLPSFQGMVVEDLDTFLFEFDVHVEVMITPQMLRS